MVACDINDAVVRSLWGIMGAFELVTALVSLNALQFEVAALVRRGGRFGEWEKSILFTRLACLACLALKSIVFVIGTFMKATASSLEDRRIGNDPVLTALFATGAGLFFIGVPLFVFSSV
jgi:hypothetical protein